MKPVATIVVIALFFCMAAAGLGSEGEVALFNSAGVATAYIAADDTVYLWSGEPVAYLMKADDGSAHIYGFNGKHLGWFKDGIVLDNQGNAVGAWEDAFSEPLDTPYKGYKDYKPFKDGREYAPRRPRYTNQWSTISFKSFLRQGASE